MEAAVKKLEFLLMKTERDLDSLSTKLDQEFMHLPEFSGVNTNLEPSSILNNIRELHLELNKISDDVQQLQREQGEVMAEMKDRLSNLSDQFLELNNITEAAQKENNDSSNNILKGNI